MVIFFFKKFFLFVILKLCAEFQYPTMSATGQKVCGGGGGGGGVVVVWWLKPTLVFSLVQAEQLSTTNFICKMINLNFL